MNAMSYSNADIASLTAEIPEFTDDYTDVGARVTHGAVTDDYTDVGARVTHGAVTDDYMDVRLQGWRTTAGMQALEQRREPLPSSRNACSRYRENIALSKLRTCAAMENLLRVFWVRDPAIFTDRGATSSRGQHRNPEVGHRRFCRVSELTDSPECNVQRLRLASGQVV